MVFSLRISKKNMVYVPEIDKLFIKQRSSDKELAAFKRFDAPVA
jgi:hypothetical protein